MEDKKKEKEVKKKRPYKKPKIESEKLHTYGAVCNGTTTGGRKISASVPYNCNSTRLNS